MTIQNTLRTALALVLTLPIATGAADWTASVGPDAEEVLPPGSSSPQTLQFGEAVAIHGSMALAGMPSYDAARGRVAVFTRAADGAWNRTGTLTAPGLIEGDAFGQGVALRGRFAVVSSARAVHVYYFNQQWHRIQSLASAPDAWFNSAIDFEIPYLVVGGGSDDGPGAAYLFQFDPARSRFQRLGRFLAPTGSAAEGFGSSVAIWNDVVAVGAPGYNDGQGTAYVFRRTSNGWQRQQLLHGMGMAHDEYGSSIDVRGSTLVVGARNENPVGPAPDDYVAGGAAHVFTYSAQRWQPSQRLRPTPLQSNWYLSFGSQVQLLGERLAVSAPYGPTRFDQALVFLYSRNAGRYSFADVLGGEPSLGSGLSLSATALMAGIPYDPLYSIGYAVIYELGAAAP